MNFRNTLSIIILAILILALPITLFLIKHQQENRSHASSPDQLEAEYGVLNSLAQTKTDSRASGGNYVEFQSQSMNPTPTGTQTSTGIYGPLVIGDSLNNSPIGGTWNTKSSNRFRSTENSALNSVRVYIIDENHPGYGGGTGGTIRITVQTDNGTSNHAPSGTILATTDIPSPNNGAGQLYSFPSPPTLIKGNLYHIVFENIDPNPVVNFVSTDLMFQFNMDGSNSQWQPGISNIDWAELTKTPTGSWTTNRGSGKGTNTPIMQLAYANGAYSGVGYIEFWSFPDRSQTKTITGANDKVREKIIVSGGNRIITKANIKLKRVSGVGPLTARLEKGDGTLLEQGVIPSSQIPIGDPTNLNDSPDWASYQFNSSQALINGQTYNLVFSTDANTQYNLFPIRKGKSYGYQPVTYFADGQAQETSDGGNTWVFPISWTSNSVPRSPEGDWQFYFNTQ